MKNNIASFLRSIILFMVVLAAMVCLLPATELGKTVIKVTASSWEQKAKGGWGDMPPEHSLDGNLKTSWRAEGDGEWIQYDFGTVQSLKAVKLAFTKGDSLVYTVDILTSETGADNSWTPVLKAVKNSGKGLDPELFEFKTAPARYVRIVGHGNTSAEFPKWCNITEAAFVVE
jgi:hypothetical protein